MPTTYCKGGTIPHLKSLSSSKWPIFPLMLVNVEFWHGSLDGNLENSIWPNDIIITWHSWLVLSCIGSQWARWSTFKYMTSACCSCLQHASETLHLPQLHLYIFSTSWFMYAIGSSSFYLFLHNKVNLLWNANRHSLYHCLEYNDIFCALIILCKKPHHLTEGFISNTRQTLWSEFGEKSCY